MIHYHGLPINPLSAAASVIAGGHAFVTFAQPAQLLVALEVAQSFAVDNGAFSFWRGGKTPDWDRYTEWVAYLGRLPGFDFAVIPDVIDGSESDNDRLIAAWPWFLPKHKWYGAPVWHLHESLERLERLAGNWPRVCLGSSGAYSGIGTPAWWNRMAEAFDVLCDKEGRPICKVHGLRMLNPEVFTRFPFSSADSTNVAQNAGSLDGRWSGGYEPPDKEWKGRVIRARIESQQSPQTWKRPPIQTALCFSRIESSSLAVVEELPLQPGG